MIYAYAYSDIDTFLENIALGAEYNVRKIYDWVTSKFSRENDECAKKYYEEIARAFDCGENTDIQMVICDAINELSDNYADRRRAMKRFVIEYDWLSNHPQASKVPKNAYADYLRSL